MRRQFVSNVAFYSTTAVLILIIVLCIGATVKSESRDETQRMENRIQEQQLMSDMKQYLNENGYRNSGVTLTYALEEDGSPDYTFTIHHKKMQHHKFVRRCESLPRGGRWPGESRVG